MWDESFAEPFEKPPPIPHSCDARNDLPEQELCQGIRRHRCRWRSNL